MRGILILAIVIFNCPVKGQAKKFININSLSPTEFYSQLQVSDNKVIIDIRNQEAFDSVRIENSIFISNTDRLKQFADSISTCASVFVYSEDGTNSAEACIILTEKGILNVFELRGGLCDYRLLNLPIKKITIHKLKLR